MKAEEIAKGLAEYQKVGKEVIAAAGVGKHDVHALDAVAQMLFEIAAQLAEMNENLKKLRIDGLSVTTFKP